MIWQYLKSNIRGAASKISYGKEGDRVCVIENIVEMILVMNERGEKFHVRAEDISSTPILKKQDDELLPMQNIEVDEIRKHPRSKQKAGRGNTQKGGTLF